MIELLAPAGGQESAHVAINSGANAIYLGLTSFSARSSAENFDFTSLKNLISYAHALDVKVYVAMNTLIKQSELSSFIKTAVKVWNLGVNAIIVQDIFIGKILKEKYPNMILHLSTQAGTNNTYGATLAKNYGFSRVILARETPISQIEKITKIIETEVFIQGALCTCFSGQCYLSSFAGGNSGNRGKCKQPCRKQYILSPNGDEKYYAISLSDLCVGEDIQKLIGVGVVSFKIEGRMRRPEYVASALNYYRAILDNKSAQTQFSDLKRTYNRGNYTKGLAFGQDKSFLSSAVQGHVGEYVGTVKVENGKYTVQTKMLATVGDGFKILRAGKEVCGAICTAKERDKLILQTKFKLKNGDKAFITTDNELAKRLLSATKKLPINITVSISENAIPTAQINGKTYVGAEVAQVAQNRPIQAHDVNKCFQKTDAYPFKIDEFVAQTSQNAFMPISKLNEFRRKVYAEFYADITANENVIYEYVESDFAPYLNVKNGNQNNKTALICQDFNGIDCDVAIFKPTDYFQDFTKYIKNFKGEKYLYLPAYATDDFLERLKDKLALFDGVYSEGYYGILYAEEVGKKLFAGLGFNLSNGVDISALNGHYVSLSKELTKDETFSLCNENTFYLTCGDVKVMDLIYCPLEKKCSACKMMDGAYLQDENGRVFPLKRYKTDGCHFELFNCSTLVAENNFTGKIFDCTLTSARLILENCHDVNQLKSKIKNHTAGHSRSPIF